MIRPPPRSTPPTHPFTHTSSCRSPSAGLPDRLLRRLRVPLQAAAEGHRGAVPRSGAPHGRRLRNPRRRPLRPARQGTVVLAGVAFSQPVIPAERSEEHTSELQSLMRISYAVFCLKKKNTQNT